MRPCSRRFEDFLITSRSPSRRLCEATQLAATFAHRTSTCILVDPMMQEKNVQGPQGSALSKEPNGGDGKKINSFLSTNYSRIAFDLALGFWIAWISSDSKAPWLGYSFLSAIILFTVVGQSRILVRNDGIWMTYFLRPIFRNCFIPIDTVKSIEWKSGAYSASSFVRLRYSRGSKEASMGITAGPSDWDLICDILRQGNPAITVVHPH